MADIMEFQAIEQFVKFVSEGISEKAISNFRRKRLLGRKDSVEQLRKKLEEKSTTRHMTSDLREIFKPAWEEILKGCINKSDRNVKIYEAFQEHKYRLAEIGDYFGMHGASVSRIIKEWRWKMG